MRNVQTWQKVSSLLDLLNFLMDKQIATRISRIPFVPLIVATVKLVIGRLVHVVMEVEYWRHLVTVGGKVKESSSLQSV
jgi:putative effector of murein hydrolase